MGENEQHEPIDYGEVVGRSFIDKLLLAIIDAYPVQERSPARSAQQRLVRLRTARKALLGQAESKGRPKSSDEAILRWMGSELYKDRARQRMAQLKGELAPRARSDRELAAAALRQFTLPESRAESIRAQFGRQRRKWLDIELYHDDVPEALDLNLLDRIKSILARRGIEMDLDRIERARAHSRGRPASCCMMCIGRTSGFNVG